MASVHDVAAYILDKRGPMTAMKLQKLVYYSQAWSLSWDEAPLFDEEIEAWANGPVVPVLFNEHKGQYTLTTWPLGNSKNLSDLQVETVDAVLDYYGDKSSQWLSDLTHNEDPWVEARAGLAPSQRGCNTINHASLAFYYQGLAKNG